MGYHKLFVGDALTVLRQLPAASVDAVVTSPPYWHLRSYLSDCHPDKIRELGAEPMLDCLGWATGQACGECYICHMVEVFSEVRRVLRQHGTLWLIVGDSYINDPGNGRGKKPERATLGNGGANPHRSGMNKLRGGLKRKDRCMVPARLALALQADGWWLRSEIVWHKPNCMPRSVTDRPTDAHEMVYLLSKSIRYYYDAEAIKEPATMGDHPRTVDCRYQAPGQPQHNGLRRFGLEIQGSVVPGTLMRNKRSVWLIPTQPYPDAHFATFPQDLAKQCILAATSGQACPCCGAPWERIIERTGHVNRREPSHVPNNSPTKTDSTDWAPLTRGTDRFRPTCECPGNDGSKVAVVLDPFGGAGTTTMVAMALGRDSIYIDLNPAYARMAIRRAGLGSGMLDCHTYELIEAGGEASCQVSG